MMIAVAVVALLLVAVPMGWRTYGCWAKARGLAADSRRWAQGALMRADLMRGEWADRNAIRRSLVMDKEFAERSPGDQELAISAEVFHLKSYEKTMRVEASLLDERARLQESEAARCWNPFASHSD